MSLGGTIFDSERGLLLHRAWKEARRLRPYLSGDGDLLPA